MASTDFEWSPEYCLSCDRQTTEGAYCSQACRLADLEKAGMSEPTSPTTNFYAASAPSSYASTSTTPGSGLYLPPAVNFAAYKVPKSAPLSPRTAAPSQQSYFSSPQQPTSSSRSRSNKANLTPSSSRSSLSSVKSGSTTQGAQCISDDALSQLRDYVNSFDQVRDMKRRLTLV